MPNPTQKTRAQKVKIWSDFSRCQPRLPSSSEPPLGAVCPSTETRSSYFEPISHFSRFDPLMKPFARPSDRCHDAYEYCNLLKNSRPSWPSFTPHTPQNVKSWGRTDEENTQYLPCSWFWFFFFFFNNDLKNQFWCISLNEGLRVFWQIINFHIWGKFGIFRQNYYFSENYIFSKNPPRVIVSGPEF